MSMPMKMLLVPLERICWLFLLVQSALPSHCFFRKIGGILSQSHLMFLLDKEDRIVEYEDMAMRQREEKQRKEEEGPVFAFLDKFGHVEKKMESLYGIEAVKDEVHAFVDSFDPSRVITTADVEVFRENMAKKHKHRY